MPSTRRRFLAGVTALTGGLAGCNESTSRAVRGTVTPVEVPRTDRELLHQANAVETPSIRPAVLVSDAHLESAIDQLERLRDSLLEAVESRTEPVEDEGPFRRDSTPEEIVEQVEEHIQRARQVGPSREAIEALRGMLHDVTRAVGYLQAESGDLTMADVEDAIQAERAAVRGIRDDLAYRVAAPVAENLPTVHAAEETLRRLGGDAPREVRTGSGDDAETDEAASEPRPRPTPEPDSEDVAHRYYRLERVRRQRDDVEQYLETATDDGAPSVRSALESQLADVRAALEPVADEYRSEEESTGGDSVVERLGGMRQSAGSRTARYLSRSPDDPPDGDLVWALFDAVERLVSFRAIDVGVERTLDRLDGRRFPTETLLEEKRRAVENLERAADQPALHRAFVQRATQVLRSADHIPREEEAASLREVTHTHALYVAAAEWADRGVARGDGLSESLQAQQS